MNNLSVPPAGSARETAAALIARREALANDIFKNNPSRFHSDDRGKDAAYLGEITRTILDRIVFMRLCEDRGLTSRPSLRDLFEGRDDTASLDTMLFLRQGFEDYDALFNGNLFKHQAWEDDLNVTFKELKKIVLDLGCFHHFDAIPLDILGNIHEQYLASAFRLTGQAVTIENKPEIGRKGLGAYYTPQYIVDYMVKNTVGKLLEEPSPQKADTIKILDPACGSGNFLIKAYDVMLQHRLLRKRRALKKTDRTGSPPMKHEENVDLTLQEKRDVLLNHIFGVDIDSRAVEITKLSLLLKMLEGEDGVIAGRAVLPALDRNIKCGNSLIGTDYFSGQPAPDDKEMRRINPFDWEGKDGFPAIMRSGGFDVVIGNPPWGQKEIVKSKSASEYLFRKYASCRGIFDLFRPFIEASIDLTKRKGQWGLVLPDVVLLKNYPPTRKFILENLALSGIVFWGMVFKDATIDAVTMVGQKNPTAEERKISPIEVVAKENDKIIKRTVQQHNYDIAPEYKFNLFFSEDTATLLSKIRKYPALATYCEPHEGVHSGNIREKLFLGRKKNRDCLPLIFGREEIRRYCLTWSGKYVDLSPATIDRSHGEYANYGRSEWYAKPKLVIRRTGDRLICSIDYDGFYFSNNAFVAPLTDKCNLDIRFLLGLLNSRFMTWFYLAIQPRKGRAFAEVKIKHLRQFPLPPLDFSQVHDRNRHDRMVTLVDSMLDLQKRLKTVTSASGRSWYQRRIDAADAGIDRLVYELYGLTEAEIKLVEGERR